MGELVQLHRELRRGWGETEVGGMRTRTAGCKGLHIRWSHRWSPFYYPVLRVVGNVQSLWAPVKVVLIVVRGSSSRPVNRLHASGGTQVSGSCSEPTQLTRFPQSVQIFTINFRTDFVFLCGYVVFKFTLKSWISIAFIIYCIADHCVLSLSSNSFNHGILMSFKEKNYDLEVQNSYLIVFVSSATNKLRYK